MKSCIKFKMTIMHKLIIGLLGLTLLVACKKDEPVEPDPPKLKFSVEFDETLPRLGNFGEAVTVAPGNAAQSPNMNGVSLHYIELAPSGLTPLTEGAIVYEGEETLLGGAKAVDFDKAGTFAHGETVLTVDLSTLPPGTYKWIRASLTYQNYEIDYRYNNPPYADNLDLKGTLASFVGYNTYISSHKVKDSTIVVNDDMLQGYWAFETGGTIGGFTFGDVFEGEGAGVTVVNPISDTSPIPPGSCVITGELEAPLVITGNETEDVEIVLALSTNQSFEWEEVVEDGKFEPGVGETVVDMGLRGLHPRKK